VKEALEPPLKVGANRDRGLLRRRWNFKDLEFAEKENSGKARVCFLLLFVMKKVIGYMLTWTTYGTWLQGDNKGWVKEGEVYRPNEKLKTVNEESQKKKRVALSKSAIKQVESAILQEAEKLKQKIFAITVGPTHVHIVCKKIEETIEVVAARYKTKARKALKELGYNGKIWTKGYYKGYCYSKAELQNRIDYVNGHIGRRKRP